MKKRTRVTHLPDTGLPPDNRALVAPIYQSVKFTFDDVAETERFFEGRREGHYYSRVSNPTLRQLETALAGLQGGDACLLTASGMAAISASLLALTKQGDHVVYFAEMYQPTRRLIRRVLGRFGVTSTLLSIDDLDSLERVLLERPVRAIVFESPSNPVLKVADIPRITELARRHGALTLLDNTLAGPASHGELDLDLYLHSLTKYVSGHGDVMGGAVIGRAELIHAMRTELNVLGPTLDPHAAFLMLRGLKSYFVRRDAQCRSALSIAEFLSAHPDVERVRYPGLAADPGHERARRQMEDFGTIVSFDIAGGIAAGTRFAEALALFAIAASLGSTESLVVPPAMQQPQDLTPEQRAWSGITAGTVRLSVGVEDVDDLIGDLEQALARSKA
jgi:cystathionine beta-lyase/cystathionine gamma-synthase